MCADDLRAIRESRTAPFLTIFNLLVAEIRHVHHPEGWIEGAFDAELAPGMVLCAEALVSPEGADFSIKLEDQVLITESGCETLTRYPFDPRLT